MNISFILFLNVQLDVCEKSHIVRVNCSKLIELHMHYTSSVILSRNSSSAIANL